MSSARGSYPGIFVLFLLSGATGLIYEVIWLRQLVLIFGSTQFATSTILSTFMGGLALGAYLAGRWPRMQTGSPLRIYGVLEIAIGLYALAVPFLFRSLTPIYRVIWEAGASDSFILLSLAKFVGIGLVLLPPTVLMGASLPVLARQIADDPDHIGGKVGGLYAINIFGAVAGVFIAGFLAVPILGVQTSILVTAFVNVLIGLAAFALAPRFGPPSVAKSDTDDSGKSKTFQLPPSWVRLTLVVFGLSGFGALVLEVAWTRVLSLVLGSSVYAFSLMLLAFLIGLAFGGAFFSALLRRFDLNPPRLLAGLLATSGLLAYLSAVLFPLLPRLLAEMLFAWKPEPTGWFVLQFIIGLVLMFPTTFALGGIFPTVLQIHASDLDGVSDSVGTVYASNTVGTILGAAVAGFVLIPNLGVLNTVVAIALAQLGLALLVIITMLAENTRSRLLFAGGAIVLLAGLFVMRPAWDVQAMNAGVFNLFGDEEETSWAEYQGDPDDTVVVYEAEGLTAHIFVADEPKYNNRYLSVNGKVEASTQSDLETQLLAAHLPLLIHENPESVMVIGLASGISAGAAAAHPVESIRILEIEKKIVRAAELFASHNGNILDDERVVLSFNDARNELEFSPETYDVVVSEPSNPWMTIAANLFTEDFFRLAASRMRPGGIYCQWVQNYYLPGEDLKSIVAAFRKSFPNVMMFESAGSVDLLLLGAQEPLALDLDRMAGRLAELSVRLDLARVDMSSPLEILSTFRMGDREIERLVKNAARNTDNNARVEFSAPRNLGQETISDNLAMLRKFGGNPLDYISPAITDPLERDQLSLGLAGVLMGRGHPDLARSAAMRVSEGPLKMRADELQAQAEEMLAEERATPGG